MGFPPVILSALNHSLAMVNIAVSYIHALGPSCNTPAINHRFSFDDMLAAYNNAHVNVTIVCC
jgi:hypothetical protein